LKEAEPNVLRPDELIEALTDQVCDRVTESLDAVARGIERRIILRVLGRTGGNQTEAAKLLGIKRTTLNYKMKKMNIPSPRARRMLFADERHIGIR
jgi:DNA-binding NtrC family response regulator